MNKTIDQLPEKSAIAVNDEFIIFDPSDRVSKKIKGSNMQFPFQYSTKEQFTGKYWIDGKPIYCQVRQGTCTNTGEHQIGNAINNMDTIINLHGTANRNDGNRYPLTFADGFTLNDVLNLYVNQNNYICVYKFSGWADSTLNINVIIEYTKTTD